MEHKFNVMPLKSAYMIGLFSCVDAQVALEGLQVSEARPTDFTGVWLLSRVDQNMGAQMCHLKDNNNKKKKGQHS